MSLLFLLLFLLLLLLLFYYFYLKLWVYGISCWLDLRYSGHPFPAGFIIYLNYDDEGVTFHHFKIKVTGIDHESQKIFSSMYADDKWLLLINDFCAYIYAYL